MSNIITLLGYDNIRKSTIIAESPNEFWNGYNIGTMALKHASASSPVIIIINEIDIFYDKVFDEQPTYDPRTQYTKNKLTFNTMLDNLSDTKHVITIYTTEKSYEELQSIERIKSFIRHGRVDFFINMTADKSTLIENNSQ